MTTARLALGKLSVNDGTSQAYQQLSNLKSFDPGSESPKLEDASYLDQGDAIMRTKPGAIDPGKFSAEFEFDAGTLARLYTLLALGVTDTCPLWKYQGLDSAGAPTGESWIFSGWLESVTPVYSSFGAIAEIKIEGKRNGAITFAHS